MIRPSANRGRRAAAILSNRSAQTDTGHRMVVARMDIPVRGQAVVSAKITQNVVIITSFRLVQMANGAELNPVSMAAVPQQMLVINHLITKI